MVETKSVPVTKRMVWEAFKKVKKNQGAAGVDKQTIAVFEERLSDNLYVLWNRMTSGSYYPPSVRIVEIPKKDGKKRRLGIPTVSDRIAQMVLKEYLEPRYEAIFNQNSYGYRPNLKAHDALTKCINNCYKFCWVIDLDIKAFFDNLDHELLLKMLQVETKETWVVRYIKRWLEAPAENEGETIRRTKGTPQGGVISPLLANVYLHYVFDLWMKIKQQKNPFERYADDVIVHCQTREEAEALLEMIKERLKNFGLEVNAEKTKIIYCKKNRRNEKYDYVSFDFLGYQFKPRLSMTKEKEFFLGYGAGISRQAKKSTGKKCNSKHNCGSSNSIRATE